MTEFRAQLANISLFAQWLLPVSQFLFSSYPVRNLGVMFDNGVTMSAQAASIIRSANYHLTNISRARKMFWVLKQSSWPYTLWYFQTGLLQQSLNWNTKILIKTSSCLPQLTLLSIRKSLTPSLQSSLLFSKAPCATAYQIQSVQGLP